MMTVSDGFCRTSLQSTLHGRAWRADGDRGFIRTGSLSVLNCTEKRSNACARTDQCAERLKMHESRESQLLQLGFGPIVTKNA
jgi:hypothetical protein